MKYINEISKMFQIYSWHVSSLIGLKSLEKDHFDGSQSLSAISISWIQIIVDLHSFCKNCLIGPISIFLSCLILSRHGVYHGSIELSLFWCFLSLFNLSVFVAIVLSFIQIDYLLSSPQPHLFLPPRDSRFYRPSFLIVCLEFYQSF